jgi:hypothetical protein
VEWQAFVLLQPAMGAVKFHLEISNTTPEEKCYQQKKQ